MANEKLNLSNFIVDRVISGVAYNSKDEVLFKMDQCQNTSITCGSESTDIMDNVGSPIMTLYRSKTCEISGENAILDFGITSYQMGMANGKNVATAGNTILVPAQEIFAAAGTYALKHEPTAIPKFVYVLNDDSSLGDRLEYKEETTPADGAVYSEMEKTFGYDKGTHTIYLPIGDDKVPANAQMFVSYEYNSDAAVEVVNSAKNFPKTCKLVLRVLGYNPCNRDNKLGAYIIFPAFTMSPDFDLSLNAGEAQSWSGKASQDYCSPEKTLMRICIVDEADDTF